MSSELTTILILLIVILFLNLMVFIEGMRSKLQFKVLVIIGSVLSLIIGVFWIFGVDGFFGFKKYEFLKLFRI